MQSLFTEKYYINNKIKYWLFNYLDAETKAETYLATTDDYIVTTGSTLGMSWFLYCILFIVYLLQ